MTTKLPARLLAVGLLLAAGLLPARAQNVPFTAAAIPNKEALKVAKQALETGQASYEASLPDYTAALTQFLEAQKVNPNNGALNLRIGDCYQHLGQRDKALPYLEKAADLETGPAAPKAHYALARAYQLAGRWQDALKELDKAAPTGTMSKKAAVVASDYTGSDVLRRIAECKTGQRLMKTPTRLFVDTLGTAVNSAGDDFNPVVNADESVLLFSSARAGGRGEADVYQARWDGEKWRPATSAGSSLNSGGNDVVVALSPDGQHALLHADGNEGDLSIAHLTGDGWGKPQRLGSNINSKGRETAATFSPDGRYVYFVSDREGGLGGSDIYMAELEGKNPAQNLGQAINTPYNEDGVFLMADGKTLLFSSQGHGTMGGYDIFRSTYENGKWSEPENLGWPLNTPGDDVSLTTTAAGRVGYLASSRPGGHGGRDIYRVTLLGPEKQGFVTIDERILASDRKAMRQPSAKVIVPVQTAEVAIVRGTVVDNSRKPIQAQIEVVNNATGQVLSSLQSSPTGKYLLSLPAGTNYGIVVRHDDLLFGSENVNLPPKAHYTVLTRDVKLQKMETGSNVVLNNVFFEPGQATLRTDSRPELDRLVKLLDDKGRLKVHICGHTDNAGADAANLELSQQRCQAIITYLTAHGVKAQRLQATGYGSSIPIASNATPEGRQQNQRIEFKVLPK